MRSPTANAQRLLTTSSMVYVKQEERLSRAWARRNRHSDRSLGVVMTDKEPTAVSDIREGPADEYWERLQSMMGRNGLMTYWYLGRAFNQMDDPDLMRLRRDMRNAVGGIMAAPLAIAAPETGGWRDREVVPAPVAYSLHILDDARDVDEIRIFRSTVRRGRKMGFSRSEIVDAAQPDRTIAITTGIGVTWSCSIRISSNRIPRYRQRRLATTSCCVRCQA